MGKHLFTVISLLLLSGCKFMTHGLDENIMLLYVRNETNETFFLNVFCEDDPLLKIVDIEISPNKGTGSLMFEVEEAKSMSDDEKYDYFVDCMSGVEILLLSENRDTLALWTDTSYIYDRKYWKIVTKKYDDFDCALTVTEEMLGK